jgi:hypothetical protein
MSADEFGCDKDNGQCHASPNLALFKQENQDVQYQQTRVPEKEKLKNHLEEM